MIGGDMGGVSFSAWEAMDAALWRLLEETLSVFTWTAAAASCLGAAALSCYGIYASAGHLLGRRLGPLEIVDSLPPAGVDDRVVHREAVRGIAALESWLAQASPGSAGDDGS
ncbi:MAG: hypothetical protein JHC71_02205 [Blastococcus sp.]|nr:hypothetical protein [Blastococcus sp.]